MRKEKDIYREREREIFFHFTPRIYLKLLITHFLILFYFIMFFEIIFFFVLLI